MAQRIDLRALQRQLDAFHTKFQHWAQRTEAGAEELRDGHLGRLREFQGGCNESMVDPLALNNRQHSHTAVKASSV